AEIGRWHASKNAKLRNWLTNITMGVTLTGLGYAIYQLMDAMANYPASSLVPAEITVIVTAVVATLGIASSKIAKWAQNYQERSVDIFLKLGKLQGERAT
ncbi:MAG: hypothetical protein Q8N60_04230, partial [Candidatus Diapherotrites archaeon]|nr:hypothetical protein [Candidatus Diapherotrites archaeon]